MSTHTQRHPITVGSGVNRLARAVAVGIIIFAFGSAIAYVGHLSGRASRPSDTAIAAERAASVHLAVARAVAAKGAADHEKRLRIVARHVAAQRARDRRVLQAAILREQRAGDRRAALAFARGRAQRVRSKGLRHR
jgi:hypothetical protein